MNLLKKKNLSLYIHWPYCESKCPYCDFNSHKIEAFDENKWIKSYKNQLYSMRDVLLKYEVNFDRLNTIFFGGGTPSLMPIKIIEETLNTANKIFKFDEKIEITLEANPGSSEREKFREINELGVNRISLGIQSLNDKNLCFLGRKHGYKDAILALEIAKKTFNNISVDLIYGLPDQKINEWHLELEFFLDTFNINHLSVYQLTIEAGTKFYTDFKKGFLKTISDNLSADYYELTNKILKDYNYLKYEVSNHSKKGFESKHNLNYWNSENWIGIGPGAFSRLWATNQSVKRFEIENFKSPKSWLFNNSEMSQFKSLNFIDNNETNIDLLIMGLRLVNGIKINKLLDKSITNNQKMLELIDDNIINIDNGIIKVNEEHLIKLNGILKHLIV